MHTNRLANEKSPYLLQHAHNPVDWYPWGAEAFEKARSEDKPIFLSVGYSTCHWCHVMERESFENERIAELLNQHFIPIKVDREERPDVDRIYMTFVQVTTGSGGWPMSVWLTPELEPFFGGTYFPPEARYGQPGFESVLTQLAAAWASERTQIAESAREIVAQLKQKLAVGTSGSGVARVDPGLLDSGFYAFRREFDPEHGGFGGVPKFPRPSVSNFLLRYWAGTGNREALEMTLTTLRAMAKGGMNDQLGGGFHRYSVDERWFVPHFEKMLYDQAQLAVSYLQAFQITGEAEFAAVARRTLDYVLRDLSAAEGGFYSAEDADSPDPAHPDTKREGAFYVWSAAEIRDVVKGPAAEWFCYRFGVEENGNVVQDPHGEFAGRNILYGAHSVEETAGRFGAPVEEVRAALAAAESALFEARSRRPRPHLDDKVLTAWNGLAISALALGGAVLDDPRYAQAARRAADFLRARMCDAKSGTLLRRYREGDAAVAGFLDDYAFLTQGLLDLYEAQFELEHLEAARRLTEKQIELFEDTAGGGFFGAEAAPDRVLEMKDDYDGAEPAGNSVAVLNLLRLARMTGEARFQRSAERALAAFGSRLSGVPSALPQMLAACEFLIREPREIVLVGERGAPNTRALMRALSLRFDPNRVTLLVDFEETRRKLAAGIPEIEAMRPADGRASAYVCRGYACQGPVSGVTELAALLQ